MLSVFCISVVWPIPQCSDGFSTPERRGITNWMLDNSKGGFSAPRCGRVLGVEDNLSDFVCALVYLFCPYFYFFCADHSFVWCGIWRLYVYIKKVVESFHCTTHCFLIKQVLSRQYTAICLFPTPSGSFQLVVATI